MSIGYQFLIYPPGFSYIMPVWTSRGYKVEAYPIHYGIHLVFGTSDLFLCGFLIIVLSLIHSPFIYIIDKPCDITNLSLWVHFAFVRSDLKGPVVIFAPFPNLY